MILRRELKKKNISKIAQPKPNVENLQHCNESYKCRGNVRKWKKKMTIVFHQSRKWELMCKLLASNIYQTYQREN